MSGDGNKIVNNAINQGLTYLQQAHGLDMDIEKLHEYMNSEQVVGKVEEIISSEEFESSSNKPVFLREKVVDYLIRNKPFNEMGKKILKGSLESIAEQQSFFGKLFSGKEGKQEHVGEYTSKKKDVGELVGQVMAHPELYSADPEGLKIIESAQKIYSEKGKGVLREIRYGQGKFDEEKFQTKKVEGYKNINKFFELSDKYISVIIGIFGVGLIIASGFRLTGNVIGGEFGFGAGLIGGLLLIIGMSLFLLGKK